MEGVIFSRLISNWLSVEFSIVGSAGMKLSEHLSCRPGCTHELIRCGF